MTQIDVSIAPSATRNYLPAGESSVKRKTFFDRLRSEGLDPNRFDSKANNLTDEQTTWLALGAILGSTSLLAAYVWPNSFKPENVFYWGGLSVFSIGKWAHTSIKKYIYLNEQIGADQIEEMSKQIEEKLNQEKQIDKLFKHAIYLMNGEYKMTNKDDSEKVIKLFKDGLDYILENVEFKENENKGLMHFRDVLDFILKPDDEKDLKEGLKLFVDLANNEYKMTNKEDSEKIVKLFKSRVDHILENVELKDNENKALTHLRGILDFILKPDDEKDLKEGLKLFRDGCDFALKQLETK
ncbi:MAG: hypothetical protein WAM28_07610 [Chlamydiales bacterium]